MQRLYFGEHDLFCVTYDIFVQYWLQNINRSCLVIQRGGDFDFTTDARADDGHGLLFSTFGHLLKKEI